MPKMSEKNIYLSIIIPAYNEEKRLPKTLTALDNYLLKQNYLFYKNLLHHTYSRDQLLQWHFGDFL